MISRFSAWLTVLFLSAMGSGGTALGAEAPVLWMAGQPRPEFRRVAGPSGGQTVAVNPPPLLWPAVEGKEVRYTVRLSQNATFPKDSTIQAEGLWWAMFNAHTRLAKGTWHWQYGTARQAGKQPVWSEVLRFEVSPSSRVFVPPPAQKVLAACPIAHPRVLITRAELGAFRKRWTGSLAAADYVDGAETYLKRPLPDLSKAQTAEKGRDAYEIRTFAKWASKAYAADVLEAIQYLVPAYLITGDERFGRDATRWGLFVASLDPDGVTSPSVSDFANGSCMRAMALVYDACYDLLSDADRTRMREAMAARGTRFFDAAVNRLEARSWSAHIWQKILMEFTELALAGLGEIPEADLWLAYSYELWINRFPLLGGDDGGWAEGIGYLGSSHDTLVAMPSLWSGLTRVDFFDSPWYRRIPFFQLYVWPPLSAPDSFGDGTERVHGPGDDRGLFMKTLGEKFGNPYAMWYAWQVMGARDDVIKDPLLTWRRMRLIVTGAPPQPKPPKDLPQARAFRDVGIVSMHTDLADEKKDLMLGFRSSLYGPYNHNHACQNGFTLNFGGKRLFCNSGYYIAAGDKHFLDWYTQTRAHNSVLIDGKGQPHDESSYGWIARFLHGRQISYCLGDASKAYGDAGLTRFRRHLVLLRPSTVVIYDDLAADHPAQWSWLLHSPQEITVQGQRLLAGVSTARSQVDLWGSMRLATSIDTRFDPPAENWRGKMDGDQPSPYPDQWHATVQPSEETNRMRILAVIQVRAFADAAPFDAPQPDGQGRFRVGPWRIQAELDADSDPSLFLERADGKAALAADRPSIAVARKEYQVPECGAILVEDQGEIVQTCTDELPPGRY